MTDRRIFFSRRLQTGFWTIRREDDWDVIGGGPLTHKGRSLAPVGRTCQRTWRTVLVFVNESLENEISVSSSCRRKVRAIQSRQDWLLIGFLFCWMFIFFCFERRIITIYAPRFTPNLSWVSETPKIISPIGLTIVIGHCQGGSN